MTTPPRLFRDPEAEAWLRARYLDDRWSIRRIAEAKDCGYSTVWNALDAHGIPRRTRGQTRTQSRGPSRSQATMSGGPR